MSNWWRGMAVGALVSGGIAALIRQRVTAGTAERNRHRSETLFAYHAAVALGRDVDKPRNLAKSVTVE